MHKSIIQLVDRQLQQEGIQVATRVIFDRAAIEYMFFPKGPLYAVLVISVERITGQPLSAPKHFGWLHLRSSAVYMVQIGNTDCPSASNLEQLAEVLDQAVNPFEQIATELPFCRDVSAKVYRYGLIAPNADFLTDVLVEDQVALAMPAVEAFRAELNPDVLALIAKITDSYRTDASQVLVYNFFATGSLTRQTYRIQAAMQLPWLIPMLSGLQLDDWPIETGPTQLWPGQWARIRRQIMDAIDIGLPLFKLIAKLFGVQREVVAWSRGRVLPELTHISSRDVATQMQLLSALPADQRPSTPEQWQAFDDQLNRYIRLMANAYGIPCFLLPTDWAIDNNPRGRIIEAILKNWLAEDAKNVVDGDGGRRIARWADIDDAMEFVSGFGEAVRERLDQQYRGRRAADRHHESIMFAWLRSVRLLDIVGMSRVWHRRMANAESILVAMPSTSPDQPESPWPVLLPEAITIENRIVVQLIDRQGLIAEGEVLGHCIGTYAGRCRSGGSVIFSIRSLAGDNLSTLELDLLDSGLLTIRGHKAARNGAPSDDCQLAAMELVKHLNSDAGADGRAAMAERRRLVETGKLVFARDRDSAPSPSAELAWAVVQGSRHALQFEFVG